MEMEAAVLRIVGDLVAGSSSTPITAETPLMDAGVDSLAATELSSRLCQLVGTSLSPTLLFEQPTPRAIAAHLIEQEAGDAACAPAAMDAAAPAEGASSAVALVGMAARWPGGANDDDARWKVQHASGDALGSVPASRWTLEALVDVSLLSDVQAGPLSDKSGHHQETTTTSAGQPMR